MDRGDQADRSRRAWAWVAAGVATVATALVILLWHRSGPPARYRVERDAFVVSDAGGHELWRKFFPSLIVTEYATPRLVWFGDLDGKRVVLFVPVSAATPGRQLVCYDDAGRELWRFTPGRAVHTTAESFAPPFYVSQFVVARSGKDSASRIIVTSSHYLEYPCQVALLAADGRLLREYWHSGHLDDALLTEHAGHQEVVLAGISNATKSATLVALDPGTMSGASVEENTDYQLQGFPPGVEDARLLFPRSCFNRALEPFASVEFITRDETGIFVSVEHRISPPGASVYYHFSDDLTLKTMSVTSGFEQSHASLFATRVLGHALNPQEIAALKNIRYLKGPLFPRKSTTTNPHS